MKVTVLLRKEHEMVKSLFDRFKKAGARNQNGKKEVFEEISREIMLHSQMENEVFYPELQNSASERAQQLVSDAMHDHKAVEKLIREISGLSPTDKHFEERILALMDSVERHIEKEEEIFDEARKILPEYRLEELGIEIEDRRRILDQMAA